MKKETEIVTVFIKLGNQKTDLNAILEARIKELEIDGWKVIEPTKPVHRAIDYADGGLKIKVRKYRYIHESQ